VAIFDSPSDNRKELMLTGKL